MSAFFRQSHSPRFRIHFTGMNLNPADVPGHKKHKNHKERKIHKKCDCEVNHPVGEAKFGVMWLQVPFFVPFVLFVAKRIALSRMKSRAKAQRLL